MKRCILTLVAAFCLFSFTEVRARALYQGAPRAQRRQADQMARWILRQAGEIQADSPGEHRFDGEWSLVTCQMAVIGFAQVAQAHPALAPRYRPAAAACVDWALTPDARAFGTQPWREDGLQGAPAPATHAYLGYLNTMLGAYRVLAPDGPHTAIHDDLTATLADGLRADAWAFETYPGEVYPADIAVVAASIAAHDRVTGGDHSALLADWSRRFAAAAIDPESGMLYQALSPVDGRARDRPRGSGTALAAYFLASVDPDLSAQLYQALQERTLLGAGAIREYPEGDQGRGDIDSGPVIFGVSVAATGFAIAAARSHADAPVYRRLTRTATLFGVPIRGWHWTGGGIGNAIMLAMLTAPVLDAHATFTE